MEQELEQKIYKKVKWDELMTILGDAARIYENIGDSVTSDMLVEASTLMETEPDAPTQNAFIFANRVKHRAEKAEAFCDINYVWYAKPIESFFVANYDYKMFSWAVKRGFDKNIDNLCIRLPKCELRKEEIKRLEDRIKLNT